jgi:hypothetical protein
LRTDHGSTLRPVNLGSSGRFKQRPVGDYVTSGMVH